jgi:hypothetical protein
MDLKIDSSRLTVPYMAGFLDSRAGCIRLGANGPEVIITKEGCPALLEEMARLYGGQVRQKGMQVWFLSGSAVALLKQVQPYLIGKRQECDLVLKTAVVTSPAAN